MTPAPIFTVGLANTGQASLRKALQVLGYTPAPNQLAVVQAMRAWASGGEAPPLKDILAGCDMVEIPPGPYLQKLSELLAAWPEALLIITTRDREAWMLNCLTVMAGNRPTVKPMHIAKLQTRWDAFHTATADSLKDTKRCLTLNVNNGWTPLTDFLGLKAPETPFPHQFTAAPLQRLIRKLKIKRRTSGKKPNGAKKPKPKLKK